MKKAQYLFSHLKNISSALSGKFIYLFLDYDGTLAPIARTPGEAVVTDRVKGIILRLSMAPDCKVAIVSGRALRDISGRVGLKNIVYVGNHGFEVKGPKITFRSPLSLRYRRTLEKIKSDLKRNLSHISSVLIEDKEFSLSVHYRLADKKNIPAIKAGFNTATLPYKKKDKIHIKYGKMVLEILPPIPWNKGKVVSWLLGRSQIARYDKRARALPIYIGDDKTDEDAFESLRGKGITIFVGRPGKTKAGYYLKDTEDVAKFLEIILKNIG